MVPKARVLSELARAREFLINFTTCHDSGSNMVVRIHDELDEMNESVTIENKEYSNIVEQFEIENPAVISTHTARRMQKRLGLYYKRGRPSEEIYVRLGQIQYLMNNL